jgi:hypothetical protein
LCALLFSRGAAVAELSVGCDDLTRLVQDADVIVSGTIVDVTDLGPASIAGHAGRLLTARIVVQQGVETCDNR